jgi:hypothetical protein
VPSWAKDIKVGSKLINARAETMATKPASKASVAKGRRCIVPANGFFEWQNLGDRKQPMFITLKSNVPTSCSRMVTWMVGLCGCGSSGQSRNYGARPNRPIRLSIEQPISPALTGGAFLLVIQTALNQPQ